MAPTVSIITPCLNSAATLGATLASVREQTVPAHEHIVVDGGSTDGTLELLESAPGVRYVSEPDRGLSDAYNKGVAMATGEIVGWLNADDLYLAHAVARVSAEFETHPEAIWATGRCRIIDGQGAEERRFITKYKNMLLRRYSYPLHLTQNFVSAPATFVRRAAFLDAGGLDERFRYSMDYDLWLRLGAVRPPMIIDETLACFRMAAGSLSMSGFERQFEEHVLNAREHANGHRLAAGANVLMSRSIVMAYRLMRRAREGREGRA
jgi:glycosyltransferase involved in cell wall biosynthesis